MKVKKHIYLNIYVINEVKMLGTSEFHVLLDDSIHPSLLSAQYHIDYLTK